MDSLDTSSHVTPRVIAAQISEIGRLLVAEVSEQYEYLASRKDATGHRIVTAHLFRNHLEKSTIDPALIKQLKNMGDSETHDLLELIQSIVLTSPHSLTCAFTRYKPIETAKLLLESFRDVCLAKSLGPKVVADRQISAARSKLHAGLGTIVEALTCPENSVVFSSVAAKNIRLRCAYEVYSGGSRIASMAEPQTDFDSSSAYSSITENGMYDDMTNMPIVDDSVYAGEFTEFANSLITQYPTMFAVIDNVMSHVFVSDGCSLDITHDTDDTPSSSRQSKFPLLNLSTPIGVLDSEWMSTRSASGSIDPVIIGEFLASNPEFKWEEWNAYPPSQKLAPVAQIADLMTLNFFARLQMIRNQILNFISFGLDKNDPFRRFLSGDAQRAVSFGASNPSVKYDYAFVSDDLPPTRPSIPWSQLRVVKLLDTLLAFMVDLHTRCIPHGSLDKFVSALAQIAVHIPMPAEDDLSGAIFAKLHNAAPTYTTEASGKTEKMVRKNCVMFTTEARNMFYVTHDDENDDKYMNFDEMVAWCVKNKDGGDKTIAVFLSKLKSEGDLWTIPISSIPSSLLVRLPPLSTPSDDTMDLFYSAGGGGSKNTASLELEQQPSHESESKSTPLGPLWSTTPGCHLVGSGISSIVKRTFENDTEDIAMPYLNALATSVSGFGNTETLLPNKHVYAQRFELDIVTQLCHIVTGRSGRELMLDPNTMDMALQANMDISMFKTHFESMPSLGDILHDARIRAGLECDEADVADDEDYDEDYESNTQHQNTVTKPKTVLAHFDGPSSSAKVKPIPSVSWNRIQHMLTLCMNYVSNDVMKCRTIWLYSRLSNPDCAALNHELNRFSGDFFADVFVMCMEQLVSHVGPAAAPNLEELVKSKLPTRNEARNGASKFDEICGPGIIFCSEYANPLVALRSELEFWESDNLRTSPSSKNFMPDVDDSGFHFDISKRYTECDRSIGIDSVIMPMIDAVFHNRAIGRQSYILQKTMTFSDDESVIVETQMTSSIGFAMSYLEKRAKGGPVSSIIGLLPKADQFVVKELLFEDSQQDVSSAMSCLNDAFLMWVSNVGEEVAGNLGEWLTVALCREADLPDFFRQSKWFDIPLFKRRLLCAFWYAGVRKITDDRIEDWGDTRYKRSIHSNNMVTQSQAAGHGIRMAPLSTCRTPSLINIDGPLGSAFDTIVRTLQTCNAVAQAVSCQDLPIDARALKNVSGVSFDERFNKATLGGSEGSVFFRKALSQLLAEGLSYKEKLTMVDELVETLHTIRVNAFYGSSDSTVDFTSIFDIISRAKEGLSVAADNRNVDLFCKYAPVFCPSAPRLQNAVLNAIHAAQNLNDDGESKGDHAVKVLVQGPLGLNRGLAQLSFMCGISPPQNREEVELLNDTALGKVMGFLPMIKTALEVTSDESDTLFSSSDITNLINSTVKNLTSGGVGKAAISQEMSREDAVELVSLYRETLLADEMSTMMGVD